jgi:hypothetical protein
MTNSPVCNDESSEASLQWLIPIRVEQSFAYTRYVGSAAVLPVSIVRSISKADVPTVSAFGTMLMPRDRQCLECARREVLVQRWSGAVRLTV